MTSKPPKNLPGFRPSTALRSGAGTARRLRADVGEMRSGENPVPPQPLPAPGCLCLERSSALRAWTHQYYRPTRDADFLTRGNNAPERFVRIFREICAAAEPDGLEFDPGSVKAHRITEDADYEGVRVTFTARLERARIPIQIDIAFGDTVTPAPAESNFPRLLPAPRPRLLAYPKESVVAEKFEAMVKLGVANSRMKDFYDLYVLSRTLAFDGRNLSEAVRKTFENRGTALPEGTLPLAFTPEFYDEAGKKRQWAAFASRNASYMDKLDFRELIKALVVFLVPVTDALRKEKSFTAQWKPGGPWRDESQG